MSKDEKQQIAEVDFSTILASNAHDIKNSMLMAINMLDQLSCLCSSRDKKTQQTFFQLQYELGRSSNGLIQLLSLFRMGEAQYHLTIQENNVYDFLDDIIANNTPLLEFKHINAKLKCDESLFWNFDTALVSGVINTIMNNAIRYTMQSIFINASVKNGLLFIQIEDDGEGYPNSLMEDIENKDRGISFSSGSTGLGLYFANIVARMHNHDDKNGVINITNSHRYGGAKFEMIIP